MPFICKNACSRKQGIGRTWEQRRKLKTRHEVPDDKMFPFRSHGRCRTCQAWQRKSMGLRCYCCGSKLSQRPRESSKRRKYMINA